MAFRFILIGLLLVTPARAQTQSLCFGETHAGRIEHAVQPPAFGPNFRAYCSACIVLGRTFGHSRAVAAMLDAYGALVHSHPETRFVYGEIGFAEGGPFPPHRTHQNGLSFDFMTPLVPTAAPGGEPPTVLSNRFGYDVEYDAGGHMITSGSWPNAFAISDATRIDFDATAAHLIALADAAEQQGGAIRRVIFAPDLQPALRAARDGDEVFARLTFNAHQSWVRHDDHYHVDFDFPCAPL